MKNKIAALCIITTLIFTALFIGTRPIQAAVSPLEIDLGDAQESGMGGGTNYWDLQKNMAVDFGRGEIIFLFGDSNTRLEYKGGEGGGFMDVGQISKPAGKEKIQITPACLVYNDTEYIKADHFYILKTLTLGYFAVYIDDIQPSGDDYPYMNFTIYKLNSDPVKVSTQPQSQTQSPTQSSGQQNTTYTDRTAYNTGAPLVVLDNVSLCFDVPPVVDSGRTLVPLRAIFEALGATVNWDGPTQTITAIKGSIQVKLQVGGQAAYKNGVLVYLDVPAKVVNNRTLVPLRFVSEALGAEVGWDASTQTVNITSGNNNSAAPAKAPTQSTVTSGSFSLTVYKGYKFDQQTVVESSKDADINFTSNRSLGELSTDKIKEFQVKPNVSSITSQEMNDWRNYVTAPVPGYYYVIQARNGKCYLLELTSFDNQGKAQAFWKVAFRWQEINVIN